MKLARYRMPGGGESLGIVLGGNHPGGSENLLDVGDASLARSTQALHGHPPTTMMDAIAAQAGGLDALRELLAWTASRADPAWMHSPDEVEWLTPVPARSCICAGRNFGRHRIESLRANAAASTSAPAATGLANASHIDFPTGFVKLGRNLVPHRAAVKRPDDVLQFDHEVEIAVIVGRSIERVSESAARQAIFGYTVFNDLSAREWQAAEMKNQLLMLGKNFPGFGPIGPCILTADEVPDPSRLTLWLKVNGELRQHADCSDLIFGFDELLSFWSRVGLQAGDIVSTGTPDGVALHRKPDPTPYFLKPGDVVHAGVDQIGVLETHIV